ncbi:hypothetical protein M9458_057397, partial [Cirrhinus mrigala]
MWRSHRLSARSRCIYARGALPPGGIGRISPPGRGLPRRWTGCHCPAVYQAQALKRLHEGGPDQGAMQELRAATDFALRATKVTARSLGQVMSTVVVQERHLWLTLAQMAPVSQGGLFGDTVEDFAQQFSAVQKQTEALRPLPKHTMRDWQLDVELAAGERRRPRLRDRPGTPAEELRSVPDAGNQKVKEVAISSPLGSQPRVPFSSDALPPRIRTQSLISPAREPGKKMKSGFYSPYFIVPKKSGGLRPILDPRALNRSLLRLPFKMLTTKRMLTCIRRQDWFAAIDLKDAYFYVSILPRHRPFLRFAFEGRAYQYKVLPFGLSLSPRVFTKVTEAALSPLLIAHSRDLLCEHRDLVLRHLSHLGLQVNREKSKLSPVQRISFLGVELDSVNMTARLTNERAQSVLNCLNSFRHKTAVPLKTFQRLLGHMAAAAAVTPLGLLHMRPLQRWLHDRVPRWAWHRGTLRIGVSLQCRRLFSPWSDPAFLQAGVPLGQVSRHLVVYTDASSTGWGAVCSGQAASGSWTGPRLQWHINCLELLAVLLVLRRFRPMLRHKH